MRRSRFPPGCDERRVRKVLAHYGKQSDEEAVAEDEAAFVKGSRTIVKVPAALMPVIRRIIAKQAGQ